MLLVPSSTRSTSTTITAASRGAVFFWMASACLVIDILLLTCRAFVMGPHSLKLPAHYSITLTPGLQLSSNHGDESMKPQYTYRERGGAIKYIMSE